MSAEVAVKHAAANSQCDPGDVRDQVVDLGAAVEAGLDKFNGNTKCTCPYENGQEANAARAGQRKGQRCEGNKVDYFVASLRRWGRLV